MSAPTVEIGRLSATLHQDGPPASTADQLSGPLRCLVEGGLEVALRGVRLPPGRWCVRRLRLTVPLDLDRPAPALGGDWSAAVAAAIERAVREQPGEVLHYRHEVELLAELVAGAAAGRVERDWAWRQCGVLLPGDPAPSVSPGAAILAVLGRHPQLAAAALLRAAVRSGLPAVDRALGRDGWQRLAAVVALASWCGPGLGGAPESAPPEAARALARALLSGSRLAGLIHGARLRPDEGTLAAWAVLVAAETDPASLHRRPHPGLPAALAGQLRALLGQRAAVAGAADRGRRAERPGLPVPPSATGTDPATRLTEDGSDGSSAGAEPGTRRPDRPVQEPSAASPGRQPLPGRPAPADPRPGAEEWPGRPARPDEPGEPVRSVESTGEQAPPWSDGFESEQPGEQTGAATSWAGLLFLLATAAEAGLPQRALEDQALAVRPLRWVLHAAGRVLVPALAVDDPALLALAGLDAGGLAALSVASPATEHEQAAIEGLAREWATVTAARLYPDGSEEASAVVVELARRSGRVLAEPGWIEVRLAAVETDIAVRRAGLDLDPGWVPWLGAVVGYVYA